ncbi:hypothetical protein CS022_08735 [Veronia nyctiphanis]|uniref:Beta-lactamase-related domain-containing protein n=1 Tax=Veronia nyctiphanis TaxID=1278244 RepID=A0A4V1LT11_9GAMM|nr:serine hydrolase [Veronia nyctiphanis]RXJ73578.1 hypothetical protein CS022_08735 [Veronia nyctiphanis]
MRLRHACAVLMTTLGITGCVDTEKLGLLQAGTGLAAHELCSRIFVSGQQEQQIIDDVIDPVSFPMTWFWSKSVDAENKRVDISIPLMPWIQTNTAIFREGMGCTLIKERTVEELLAESIMPNRMLDNPQSHMPVNINADLQKSIQYWFEEPHSSEFKQQNTYAGLVYHQGKIIAEQYVEGHNNTMPMIGWSMGKTLTALLTGILFDKGQLKPDDVVLEANQKRPYPVTVKHLLHMSAGLEWEEVADKPSPISELLYIYGDSAAYTRTQPQVSEPGTEYLYSTGATQLLAKFIQDKLGSSSQNIYDFYTQSLFHPLGIDTAIFEFDSVGTFWGGARPFVTSRDWLKIGKMVANKGVW